MRDILQTIYSFLFVKINPHKSARKPKAQSMVEFAILLPVLIMLFSGMVEFGFMLNTYLSLLDSTRQAARLCSNGQPFLSVDANTIPVTYVDDLTFSPSCAQNVVDTLAPPSDPNSRQIVIDPIRDDVLISVLQVNVDELTQTISSIQRFPSGFVFYSLYGNQSTEYEDGAIEEYMTQNSTTPVATGILIVEVYYGYKGILKLPWVEAFMNDENPVMLHASTIMPLVAAKP